MDCGLEQHFNNLTFGFKYSGLNQFCPAGEDGELHAAAWWYAKHERILFASRDFNKRNQLNMSVYVCGIISLMWQLYGTELCQLSWDSAVKTISKKCLILPFKFLKFEWKDQSTRWISKNKHLNGPAWLIAQYWRVNPLVLSTMWQTVCWLCRNLNDVTGW